MELKNNLRTTTQWEIIENSFDPEQLVTTGSNFMIGNGYLGYRGTFEEWRAKEYTACVVTDTWDQASDSEWRELCNVPNGLFTQLYLEEDKVSVFAGSTTDYYRALDMQQGLNQRKMLWQNNSGKGVHLNVEKFASLANKHLLVMRYQFQAQQNGKYRLHTGIDGKVWSLNGEHFRSYQNIEEEELLGMQLFTYESNTEIAIMEGISLVGKPPTKSSVISKGRLHYRELEFNLEQGDEITLYKVVSINHSNEVQDPMAVAKQAVQESIHLGYKATKALHVKAWEEFWSRSDIQIAGNAEAQVLVRFNIYQAFIATPTHANLPIGARGLSCQVYQGAAFWDQETFNLAMYCYTHPDYAKRLVQYRHDTLPGAKRKAKRLGYYGAFYAWTSGKTGDELFPDFFFTDVLTGRKIRNHFNCWQIHISPDVAYGIWLYYTATGDWDFIKDYGAEMLFEVAQFLVSRVHFKKDKNQFELIRLLGPDEYHENVDNNAYTNYLSKFALEKAVWAFEQMEKTRPDLLASMLEKVGIATHALDEWKEIAEHIYLPIPDAENQVIEQFDGYFQLEDVRPDALRKRLIDPGEYWGWPNGIAVHTQVLKQADVIQLLALMDGFSQEVLTANYDYYEPRTEHGSSLSPSVHALVACKANHHEEAYRYFMESATVDLYNASKKVMSGGSFLGGIHTAAAGGVWRIVIEGFAGFQVTAEGIAFNPALPCSWEALNFRLVVKQCQLAVSINTTTVEVSSLSSNPETLGVSIHGITGQLVPGASVTAENKKPQ